MKLAPSPTCNCGLEDQTAEHTLHAEMPASADNKNKCVANSSPATHQTLQQQGGTGEDSYIHLADWTLSVAEIEKKNQRGAEKKKERKEKKKKKKKKKEKKGGGGGGGENK